MVDRTEETTDAFTLLANATRRYVLYHLQRQDSTVPFERLVEQVAAWENETTPGAVDEATLREMRSELYHVHLPLLSEHDVITYGDDAGSIDLEIDTDMLQPYLDSAKQAELGSGVSANPF